MFATVAGNEVELYNTDGSKGAARGAGVGAGIYKGLDDAFANLSVVKRIEPDMNTRAAYSEAYAHWLSILQNQIAQSKEGSVFSDKKTLEPVS